MLKITFLICLSLFTQASVLTEAKKNEYKNRPSEPAFFDDLNHCEEYYVSNGHGVARPGSWGYTQTGSLVLATIKSVRIQKDGSAKVKIRVEENLAKEISPKQVTLIWPKELKHHNISLYNKPSEFPPISSKMILNLFLDKSKKKAEIAHLSGYCRIAGTESNLLVARKIMAESKKEWEDWEYKKSQSPPDHVCWQDPDCTLPARACKFTHRGNIGFCPGVVTVGADCSHLISCEIIDKKCTLVKKNKADACVRCNDNCLLKIKNRYQIEEMVSFKACFETCAKLENFEPTPSRSP